MQNVSMSAAELLQFVIENGMLDTALVQEKIEMQKREEILKTHPYTIWEGQNGKWYTYLPDKEKGRVLKKRNSEKDIQDVIIQYWKNQSDLKKGAKKTQEMTLISLFPEWLKYKQSTTDSTSYIKRITADWNRFYAPNWEFINTRLTDFKKTDLDVWANNIIKTNHLTKKAYYNMSVIIRQMLDFAVEMEYIPENVFTRVKINSKLFQKEKKKSSESQVYKTNEKPMIIEEMWRRFRNNPENTSPLAVILCFEIGARIGEIAALRFSDIEGNYIHIQRQEVREFEAIDDFHMRFKEFKIVEHAKTDDGYRRIYLTQRARELIGFIRENNALYKNHCEDYIFVIGNQRINHYAIQEKVQRGCKNIGIPVKTMHKIRKTYISDLIDSGLNIDEVRRQAGHSDERTTYGNYCFNRKTDNQTESIIEQALFMDEVIKSNQDNLSFQKEKIEKTR